MSFWKTLLKKNRQDVDKILLNYVLTKENTGFVAEDNENIKVRYIHDGTGVVDTNGTTVTYASGIAFSEFWTGSNITINGVSYEIASMTSKTVLELTATAGVQAGVNYTFTEGRKIQLEGDLRCLYFSTMVEDFLVNEISPNVYLWESIQHPDTIVSTRFLKYNGAGFEWGTVPWKFNEVQIAYLCYCATTGVVFAQREPHGLMQGETHKRIHSSIGTTREGGGDLSGFTLDSIVATNRRPSISECELLDEDLTSILPAFTYGTGVGENTYSHLYLTGAGTIVLGNDQDELSFLSGGHPTYNFWDGMAWLRAQLPNQRFMSVWVLAIPTTEDEFSKKFRFVFVQGQSFSTSLEAERLQTPLNLNLAGLTDILPEFTYIQQIILERTATSSGNWAIADTLSLRGSRAFFMSQSGNFLSSVVANQVVYNNESSQLDATELQSAIDELAILNETIERTTDYTLALTDKGRVVLMNKVGTGTVTIPKNDTVDFPIGTIINVYNMSADNVTIAGATDVIVRGAGAIPQYGEITLRKRAANEWVMA